VTRELEPRNAFRLTSRRYDSPSRAASGFCSGDRVTSPANESGPMRLAATSAADRSGSEQGAAAERDHALRREAAARMATSLASFVAARQLRAPDASDLVVVDHIATREAAYRLRGELLAPASNNSVVLVAIEREPDNYPSYRQLHAAFGL